MRSKSNHFEIQCLINETITEILYDYYDMEENMGSTWLYARIKQMEEENTILRVDVEKLDDKNIFLERNNACLKRQLGEDRKRYDELQQEYNKLEITLNEIMEKEKIGKVALKKSMAERKRLIAKLEAAELEVQEIASLREKLEKATTEIHKCKKKVAEMTKSLDEERNRCTDLQNIVKEFETTTECLQKICESRENIIQVLRETNRELVDENEELKLLVDENSHLSIGRDSTAPNLNTESYCSVEHQTSLYDELKASGFSNTREENNTIIRELEDRVHWYELEINTLLKQTECVFEQLISIYDEERFRFCVTQNEDYNECSENTKSLGTLKRRIQILLDMFAVISSKMADIGTQLRAESRTIGNSHDVLNVPDHLECVLNTNNESIDASKVNQNYHEEIASVQPDILREDENFPLQKGPAIFRGSPQRLNMGSKVSEKTNEAMSKRNLIRRGCRRSKSDSNLIKSKFSPCLHHSFDVVIIQPLLEKTNEVVETKEKTLSDSSKEEEECKNVEEMEEQNCMQNLSSWQEYKFGGTYRSLNDSTDSSICSTPSRHNSLLGFGDFSLNELCQQQECKYSSLHLNPARLQRLPSKTLSILEEKCVNVRDADCQSIDSKNELIPSSDDCYDKMISSSQMLSNSDIHESSAVHSTPIHTNLKDTNFSMYKRITRQISKSSRRSSCGSLIRQFVDLDISNETSDLSNMHSEFYLDKKDDNEHFESVTCTNTQIVTSISNKILQHNIKNENSEKCGISDEMQFSVTTVEETEDCIGGIRESIHEMSPNYENDTNGFEKSVHVNLSNMGGLQDIFNKMENSLEENNNVLQGNDLCTPSPVQSKDLLSDVSRNSYGKQTDSSKLEIVDSEKSCIPAVSHAPANRILITPSWHTFIKCALVFILGYYLKNSISLWNTSAGAPCTWYSFEEIFNRYFPIRNRQLRPL